MVFAIEPLCILVILLEQIVGIDRGVVNAKQSVGILLVKGCDALELLTFHHIVLLNDFLGDLEGLLVVLTSIEELVFACLEHL